MSNQLSQETITECVDTLRYISRQYAMYGRLDALNMSHVSKALARVDIETMFAAENARKARASGLAHQDVHFSERPSIKIAAE